MKLESIDASEVRPAMRKLLFEPMEGSNNISVEFWIARSGEPVSIPYFQRNDNTRFVKQAFDDIVDKFT